MKKTLVEQKYELVNTVLRLTVEKAGGKDLYEVDVDALSGNDADGNFVRNQTLPGYAGFSRKDAVHQFRRVGNDLFERELETF